MISSATAFIAAGLTTAVLAALASMLDDDKWAMAAYPTALFAAVIGLAALANPQISSHLLCIASIAGSVFIALTSSMFEDDTVNGLGLAALGVIYAVMGFM